MAVLVGINPVGEALRAGRPMERLLVAKGAGGPRVQEIIDLARKSSTPVRFEDRSALDRLAGTPAHQGVVALGAAQKYAELEDVVPRALQLASAISRSAPQPVRQLKRSLAEAGRRTLAEQLEAEASAQAANYRTTDVDEGRLAARERRAPRFTGR